MSVIWIDFPEINRSYGVYCTTSALNAYLGCHTGTIAGVSISFGTGIYGNVGSGSVKVLDTSKEKALKYTTDRYGYHMLEDESEATRAFEILESVDKNKTLSIGYESIVKRCTAAPMWIMSDVINSKAPARKIQGPGISSYPGHSIKILGNTGGFAKYLIDNKIGYVLASPIVQNPNHRQRTNYSLNQAWIWIPPQHLGRCVNVAEQFGADKFPTKEIWANTVGVDLGIKDPVAVFKAAFDTGVFPEENRFRRTRGRTAKCGTGIKEAIQKALDIENPPLPKLADLLQVNQA